MTYYNVFQWHITMTYINDKYLWYTAMTYITCLTMIYAHDICHHDISETFTSCKKGYVIQVSKTSICHGDMSWDTLSWWYIIVYIIGVCHCEHYMSWWYVMAVFTMTYHHDISYISCHEICHGENRHDISHDISYVMVICHGKIILYRWHTHTRKKRNEK